MSIDLNLPKTVWLCQVILMNFAAAVVKWTYLTQKMPAIARQPQAPD
ncbi:MAG: hypothetical protein IGR93_06715 [Hydrococcus sp. C42_A2020_068]|nr:hypothetical protein [Hydrococcus sp. C42_A2020_068]